MKSCSTGRWPLLPRDSASGQKVLLHLALLSGGRGREPIEPHNLPTGSPTIPAGLRQRGASASGTMGALARPNVSLQ